MILSASGWRKVFAIGGQEQDKTSMIGEDNIAISIYAAKVFADYVKNYDMTDEKVKLKIDHTYRVCSLCQQIATQSGFDEDEIEIAWLTGLLHDVGRFEQLRRYGTFVDAKSIDHAEFGADILFKERKIRDYVEDASEDDLLEKAVRCHSAYRIPTDYNEREQRFANLLRDADKIDILKVNIGLCLVGVVIGEFLAAKSGLGYLIIYGSQVFKLDFVMLSIFLLCLLAMILYFSLQGVEKHFKGHF